MTYDHLDTDEVMPAFAAWPLPEDVFTAARARCIIRDVLTLLGCGAADIRDAELMACELATNACQHGQPPFELRIRLAEAGLVTCEVFDSLNVLPALPHGPPVALTIDELDACDMEQLEGGRGLDMVRQLAGGDLGARPSVSATALPAAGKAVWFTQSVPAAGDINTDVAGAMSPPARTS